MKMARVILFTGQIDAMSKFYGEVPGLYLCDGRDPDGNPMTAETQIRTPPGNSFR
jgi:hypothetical protein